MVAACGMYWLQSSEERMEQKWYIDPSAGERMGVRSCRFKYAVR
jgi:hypothetical protein